MSEFQVQLGPVRPPRRRRAVDRPEKGSFGQNPGSRIRRRRRRGKFFGGRKTTFVFGSGHFKAKPDFVVGRGHGVGRRHNRRFSGSNGEGGVSGGHCYHRGS